MKRKKILLTFQENGQNGGPYHSHMRIMQSGLSQKYEFIPLIIPRFKKLIKPKETIKFIKTIRNSNAPILHFTGLQLEGFHVLLLARLAGKVKTVCAVSGSVKDVIIMNPLERSITSIMEHWTLRHTDACYGVSDYVANWEILKKYSKHNYGTIYNFVEFSKKDELLLENYDKRKTDIRKALSIGEKEIVVISTGRIHKDKGYEVLLNIILSLKWENVRFLIVGKGPYLQEMQERIKKSGREKSVIFTGFREDIPELLDASDIFISCSLHETLGNSIVEASYHKLPVVATKTGGIPEIVIDNETGFLFDTGDIERAIVGLETLIKDKKIRTDYGIAGERHVKKQFCKDKIESQLDSLYEELLSEH